MQAYVSTEVDAVHFCSGRLKQIDDAQTKKYQDDQIRHMLETDRAGYRFRYPNNGAGATRAQDRYRPATGREALAHTHASRFDAITLDRMLPDMDGLALVARRAALCRRICATMRRVSSREVPHTMW
mgnify:CR=1 FL=1